MANVRFGSVPYYYTADQVEIPYRVQLSASGEGPPPEADVSEARIFLAGATEGAPAKVEQLVKNGENVLTLSLSDFTPSTDSPVMVQFYFEKRWTSGPRSGTTDTHGETILGIPLAEPAVGEIEAAPNPCKPGDAVELRVKTWGAVIYERAGADPLLDLGTADAPVDTARWPSGAQGQTKWRLGQEKDETSEPYEDLSATGEQVTESITEDHGQLLHFEAFLGEQPEALRAKTDVRGSRVALQLLFLDPDDPAPAKAIPLPQGLKVRAAYAGSEGSDVDLEADGKLTLLADRSKPALWLKLVNADTYVAYKADQTPRTKKLAKAEVDQHLKDGWFVFLLPGEFTTRMSVWTSPNAPTWQATGTLDRLDQADTALGAPAAPLKLLLDPKWQHLRFVYFDRVLGEAEPVSLPTERDGADLLPPVVEGWDTLTGPKDASDAPKTRAFWPVGVADPKKAHLALPWIVQGTDDGTAAASVPEPKATTALRLQRAEDHPFVHTAANGTRKLVNLTDANVRDKPSADRMRYYDLPKVWLSRGYFAWLEDAAGKHGPFEDVATRPTTKAKPLVFSLDDIVLTDAALAPLDPAKPAADPLHWDPTWRITLFHASFDGSTGAVPANAGPAAAPPAGKPQAPQPAARRFLTGVGLYNPEMVAAGNLGRLSKVAMAVNYVADYPHWTRLVACNGNLYDVFNKRLPLADAGVVGARAAVRWIDVTKPFAGFSMWRWDDGTNAWVAPATQDPVPGTGFFNAAGAEARPARTDGPTTDPFFSIQPYFEQRHTVRYREKFNPANDEGTGRYDQVLLRCCGLDGDQEVMTALCYFRLFWNFTVSPPTLPVSQIAYVEQFQTGVENRWNGKESGAGAMNPDPTWLLPQQAADKLKARVVWVFQGLASAHSQFRMNVQAMPRANMGGLSGVGNMGLTNYTTETTVAGGVGWFTAAHEAGHGGSLPDEYNERWGAASYGLLSFHYNTPGDAFEPDGRTVQWESNDASMMCGNRRGRNRYAWHVAEWARGVTGKAFKVKLGAFDDYKVPQHAQATRTHAHWPIAQQVEWQADAAAGRGKCTLYCYALGKDKYSQQILAGGPYDGILMVTVNVQGKNMPRVPAPPTAMHVGNTRTLREGLFEQLGAGVHAALNDKFYATGTIGGWTFTRCRIHFSPRFLDDGYVPDAGETSPPTPATIATNMGVDLEVDFDPAIVAAAPGPQWGTGPWPDEPPTQANWVTDSTGPGAARDASLQAIDARLGEYHALTHVRHDERRAKLVELVTACDTWLAGPGAVATPGAAITFRKPKVEGLKTVAAARRDHYDANLRKDRKLRLNYSGAAEARRWFTTVFPSMLGIYKAPGELVEADLLPLVRQVITTSPAVHRV